ncbi:MAG: intradiol ring-cleavage dioxygenase [Candidatus Cyclobacteriaceae bacterium M2_1C_046]
MYRLLAIVLLLGCNTSSNSQDCSNTKYENRQLAGGPCEGCEAVFEFKDVKMNSTDTLPDFNEEGMKLKITGTVYRNGSPACDVILYTYHTNQQGIYPTKGNEKGWARRHGYIRGWVKTDQEGKYTFYTIKPGSYPSRNTPAHIHITVLEPDGTYYWIDDFHFADDPLLTSKQKRNITRRGGSDGIVDPVKQGQLWVVKRDIYLGENIPGYE